jgi:hypothetical protein
MQFLECAPGATELGSCPTDATRWGPLPACVRVLAAMGSPKRMRHQSSRTFHPVEAFAPPSQGCSQALVQKHCLSSRPSWFADKFPDFWLLTDRMEWTSVISDGTEWPEANAANKAPAAELAPAPVAPNAKLAPASDAPNKASAPDPLND